MSLTAADFKYAGYTLPPVGNLQRPQCQRLLFAFVDGFGVRPFDYGYRNLRSLLAQGGAANEQVKAVLKSQWNARHGTLWDYVGKGSPFDHFEMWGRNRTPLFLIGHPYQITIEAQETLAAIRSLGLVVSDYHPSWYGFGTVQIRVYHAPTLRRVLGRVQGGLS